MRLTVRTRLNFVGIRFCFTNILLFVFTRGNRIVKRRFYFFWRTSCLEVDVQQSDTHVIRTNRLFQFALSIATNHGTTFRQNAVHGVFTDNSTQGAVGSLTQAVIRAGHAIQIFFRIGDAVLHVHLNAHYVLVRRQHHTRSGQFTHGFHVHRFDFVDKRRFPVQTRLNQMAEFTKACYHATFGFFNGIETTGRPDNDNRCRCDGNDTTAKLRARALR